jgi:DNA ligase-1
VFLARIITGELRTGASDGMVLEAIAEAGGANLAAARRAALFLGDLSAVADLLRKGGAAALATTAPRPFVPLLPMLAEIAGDVDEALAAHGGTSAVEYKYDGARIQLHRDGERVAIWSRRMSDVTRSLPDIVTIARRDLSGVPLILDGEVVALDARGRPLPFQELMRRFRRVRGVEAAAAELPLTLHLFDCLMADGRSLLDEPYTKRWEALERLTGGRWLAERAMITTAAEGDGMMARALAAGHEGLMAKDPRSPYEPGGRGKRWFKLKAAQSVDCVIVAADRGSGRRVGWLSNYHLAVRDGEGWAEVGKTFKGLTDREFTEMTERLQGLATADEGYTVRVRPEVVVEVEYNEIQKSPTYPSGFALRFARIARIREDKAPGQATTLEELRALFERQFATKGRAEP